MLSFWWPNREPEIANKSKIIPTALHINIIFATVKSQSHTCAMYTKCTVQKQQCTEYHHIHFQFRSICMLVVSVQRPLIRKIQARLLLYAHFDRYGQTHETIQKYLVFNLERRELQSRLGEFGVKKKTTVYVNRLWANSKPKKYIRIV